MKSQKYKNIFAKHQYAKNEGFKKLYKILFIQLLANPLKIKTRSLFILLARSYYFYLHKYSKTLIKNRCVLTNTSKSLIKPFSVSRMSFRHMLRLGLISGYRKAVW